MPGWWASVEVLSTIQVVARWVLIIGATLTAIGTAAHLLVADRLSDLQREREEQLQEEVDEAQQSQQALQEQLGEAERRIETLSGRTLSDEQREMLHRELTAWAEEESSVTATVQIRAATGEAEAMRFAWQLEEVLLGAGWEVPSVGRSLYDRIPPGVLVRVNREAPYGLKQAAAFLISLLDAARVGVLGGSAQNLGEDEIELVVGHNPKTLTTPG